MIELPENIVLSENIPYCSIKYSMNVDVNSLPQVTSPERAYEYLLQVWDMDTINYKEEFIVLLLNNAKRVLGWAKISSGGSTATIVEPVMVFQVALLTHANSIILAHNHPSGRMEASMSDIALTKKIHEIGGVLGVSIDDHLVISSQSYLSFREQKILTQA